jgi:hypothetical protein
MSRGREKLLLDRYDGLSPAELKLLVVNLLEEVADLHRTVAALREEPSGSQLDLRPPQLVSSPGRADDRPGENEPARMRLAQGRHYGLDHVADNIYPVSARRLFGLVDNALRCRIDIGHRSRILVVHYETKRGPSAIALLAPRKFASDHFLQAWHSGHQCTASSTGDCSVSPTAPDDTNREFNSINS